MTLKPTPALREYTALLIQLHRLMESGQGDERGDEIRDRMDRPWRKLTEEQDAIARWLSADLYTLGKPREDIESVEDGAPALDRLADAFRRKSWGEACALLTEAAPHLDPVVAATLKGMMLLDLGCFEAASEYAEAASRLQAERVVADLEALASAHSEGDPRADFQPALRLMVDDPSSELRRRLVAAYLHRDSSIPLYELLDPGRGASRPELEPLAVGKFFVANRLLARAKAG